MAVIREMKEFLGTVGVIEIIGINIGIVEIEGKDLGQGVEEMDQRPTDAGTPLNPLIPALSPIPLPRCL